MTSKLPSFGVPVLMYHAVTNELMDEQVNPIHITAAQFEEQMKWLHQEGYKTISIDEMLHAFQNNVPFEKKVVLTFDDGYQSLLTIATPILSKYNFSATLFLLTAPVSKYSYDILSNYETSYPKNEQPLSWNELNDMQSRGWDIQAHSRNHYIHNMISAEHLQNEMQGSKADVETNLKKIVSYYSFPYGSYDTRCLKLINHLGFKAGFSVHQGLANRKSDVRRLPRVEINRFCTMNDFKKKIQTGYSNKSEEIVSKVKYQFFRNTRLKDNLKSLVDHLKGK